MANYDAAINISVNGQSKIDKLIDNLSRVDRLVDSISSEPIELSIASVDKNIAQATASASAALKKFSKERETALDSLQKAQTKYQNQIVKSQSIIADAESRGATNTKKYANAVASQQLAISKLSEAQQKYGDILGAIEASELSAISTRNKNIASLERNRKSIETINKLSQQYINVSGRASRPEGVPLANLQAQVDLFRQLSNSVKTTSEDYRRFTLASVTAEIDTARESLRKYQVIADAAIPRGGRASAFGVQSAIEYKGLQSAIQELINTFPQVTKSEAGLQSYRDALASTLSLIPYGTDQYIKLAGAIKQVDQAMSARLSTADAAKPFGPAEEKLVRQGPATDLVTQGLVERQRYADRKLKVEQNLYRLTERIEDSVGDQSEKTRLLVQANQALNALSEDRLEDAARELSIIERQRQAYSRLEKQQVQGKFTPLGGGAEVAARQRFDREQLNTGRMATSPISGRSSAGIIPGSPADKQRTARARLSWLAFFSQTLDVAADQTRAATQDAVALAQQKAKEIERQTAKLWREFGGPALPPRQGRSTATSSRGTAVVDRVTGQAFRAGGPGAVTASLSSPRRLASQQTSALLLQEKLTGLEIKGVNASAERASLQQIINSLSDSNLKISDQLLNSFDDQLNSIREYIKLQNQVVSNEKARQAAEKKGGPGPELTGFAKSFSDLQKSLGESRAFFDKTSPAEAIDQIVRQFSDARGPSSGGGLGGRGKTVADNLTGTFASSLKSGAGKMVSATTSAFNQVTQAINDAFGIASPSRFIIELVKNLATTYVSQLQQEYPRIQVATERAFGGLTTERAVSQLVATNRGFEFVGRPSTGYSPLQNRSFDPSGMGGEMDEMFRRFRNQIAQLTTQPEIYRNILNALPSSAITTDLAGAASRRAAAAEIPSFMSIQRQIGPGELEREIENTFANYLKGVRIPNPWVGPIGDYEEFIARVASATRELSGGARALPGRPSQLALPPGQSQVEDRIRIAYERSAARGASVFAEELEATLRRNAAGIFGTPLLGAGGGGAGGGGAIPPGGGGGLPPGAGGAAGGGDEARSTLNQLRDLTRLSTRELGLLAQSLEEIQQELRPTAAGFDALNNQLNETRRRIQIEQAARDPDADFFARRRIDPRVGNAISEGLIGGAFPLLFGQGLGASVGGGLGGALGGFAGGGLGFGLSLIGTALGTAFDTATQKARELGDAINDSSKTFDVAKEKSIFSSKEIEKYAQRLQEAGLVAEASAVAQKEVYDKIGGQGVKELQRLSTATDRSNRAFSELALQIQSGLAGPMADLLEWVTALVGIANQRFRNESEIRNVFSGLSPEDQKAFNAEVQKRVLAGGGQSISGGFITDVDGRPIPTAQGLPAPSIEQIRAEVAKLPQFANRSRSGFEPNIRDEEAFNSAIAKYENQISQLTKEIEAIDIGKKLTDQLRDVARQQEDLNQQVFDARRQYEEAIGDIRLNIERTVQRESLDNIRAQNELYQLQGEIRLQQLNNANQALISEQGVNDYGRRLFEILGQAASLEVSTQQDIENRKRQFQLEMQSKELEAEIFKGDIAKQVAKLNEDSERRIADINKNVRRANEQYDQQRFKIEKAISDLKVKQIEAEIQFNEETVGAQLKQAQLEPSTDPKTIRYFQNLLSIYQAQSEALEKSKTTLASVTAPPKLQEVGGISTQGVSTAAYDAVRERAVAASRALLEANQGLISLARAGSWQEIKDQFVELADQGYKAAVVELQDIVEAVRNGGDAFAGAAARLAEADRKVTESLNSIGKQSETSLIKKYREGGLTDEQISLLLQLASQTNLLARAQLDGARTAEFYSDSISAVQSQIESLTQEIKEATTFGTNYEKALRDLAERGLSLADKEARDLLDSAKQLDILQDRADTLKNIRTASEGLTGSLRGLIENFYELGSASKALEAFNKEMSQKALSLVLDIAFKPVEENIRKSLIMFGEKVGLNFKTPVEQQLTELQKANATITSIKTGVDALVSKIVASQPAQATTSVAPGFQAAQVVTGPASQRTAGLPIDYVNSVVSGQSPQIRARLQSATTVDEVLSRGEAIKREYLNTAASFNISDPAARSQLNKLLNDLVIEGVKNRADEIRKFAGQGGPIESFPMSADPDADLPTPSQLRGAASLADEFSNSIRPIPSTLRDATGQINSTSAQTTEELRRQNAAVAQVVPQWQKNLGGVVTGLGLATTGVIGILGGIQQIQQGGTAGVLSGIGGILTTVGSIGLSVAGMFGGGGGGGGFGPNYFDPKTGLGAAGPNFGLAMGGVFDSSSRLTAFAKGGVVKSPTLFRFGDGGQFGVMGEAGAEAVMPLKRGPDGRLGVEQVSEGGDSSSRLREAMGRSPAQGGQASEVRIKFETTVINGVEYVSKDQLDQAMEQTRKASVSEGAKRGMGMTLDKLKQSPSTRSRVGIR